MISGSSHWNSLQTIYGFRIAENCPVVVERGAFLQDSTSALLFLQLKFVNYGPEPIRGIRVSGMLIDAMYNAVSGGAFQQEYTDLHCEMLGAFGTKKLIQVPSTAKYVWITNLQITYASGATAEYTGDRDCCCQSWCPIDLPAPLRQSLADVEIEPSAAGDRFHRCCCGSLSPNTIPCPRCGRTLEQARFAVTREGLSKAAPAGYPSGTQAPRAPAYTARPWEAAPDEDKFPLKKVVDIGTLILVLALSVFATGNVLDQFFYEISDGWLDSNTRFVFSCICWVAFYLPVVFAFVKNTAHKWWFAAGMMLLSLVALAFTASTYSGATGFLLLLLGALVVTYLDFVDRKKYKKLHTNVNVYVQQNGGGNPLRQQQGNGTSTAKEPSVGPQIILLVLAMMSAFGYLAIWFGEFISDDEAAMWCGLIVTVLLYLPVGIALVKNATHKWWFVAAMFVVSLVAGWSMAGAGFWVLLLVSLVIAYLDFVDRKKYKHLRSDVDVHINRKR